MSESQELKTRGSSTILDKLMVIDLLIMSVALAVAVLWHDYPLFPYVLGGSLIALAGLLALYLILYIRGLIAFLGYIGCAMIGLFGYMMVTWV